MGRLKIKLEVVRQLFAYSGNQCAYPGCEQELITSSGQLVGEICHIEAANIGGARYNEHQNDEERRSFDNLILLCRNHHKISDVCDTAFLKKIKEEQNALQHNFKVPKEHELEIFDNLLQKIDELLDRSDQQLIQQQQHLQVSLENQAMLKQLLNKGSVEAVHNDTAIYAQQLDFIIDLKKRGQYNTALDLLLEYQKSHWQELSSELQYKTNANIAVLYLHLINKEESINWLLSLLDIPYEHPNRYAYLGLGYGLKKDHEGFQSVFDIALQLGCEHSNLWLGYLFLHEESMSAEKIEKAIPASQLIKAEIALNLSNIYYRQGNTEKSNALLSSILHLEKEPILLAEIKATLGSRTLPKLVNQFKVLRQQYSKEEITAIELAHRTLSESWDTLKNTDLAKHRTYVLLNRGVLNRILQRHEEANDDFLTAYRLSHAYLPFKNLVINYIIEGQYQKASFLIQQYLTSGLSITEEERIEITHMEARMLHMENRIDESIAKLRSLLIAVNSSHHKNILLSIGHILSEKGREDELDQLLSELIQSYPDDLEVIVFYLQERISRPPSEECSQYIQKAESMIDDATDPLLVHFFARVFIDIQEYPKALPYLLKIGNISVWNEVTHDIITCYYVMENLRKVIEIAAPLQQANPGDFILTKRLFDCYERISKPDSAVEVAQIYLQQSGEKKKNIIKYDLALLFYRNKRNADVLQTIQSISSYDDLRLELKFQIAFWHGILGDKQKGLELAFHFRSLHYDDVAAHRYYIGLLRDVANSNDEAFPTIADSSCGFDLVNDDGKIDHYLISDDLIRGENVIRSQHPLAIALVGKSKGEIVSFDKGYGLFKNYTIHQILNKYTYAAQESIRLLDTRFSGESGLVVMKLGKDHPFAELEILLRNQAKEKSEFESQVFHLHLSQKVPFSTIVQRSGEGYLKIWSTWRSAPSFYQIAYAGNNRQVLQDAYHNGQPIVIDISVLCFCCFYDLYELLEKLPPVRFIAQSALDEFERAYAEASQYATTGRKSIDYVEGQLYSQVSGIEEVKNYLAKLEVMIAWCKDNASVTGPSVTVSFWKDRDVMIHVLGVAVTDSIFLAEEYQAIYLSDDALLSSYLGSGNHIKSINSFDLCSHCFDSGSISPAIFNTVYAKMMDASYISIPGDYQQVWTTYDRSNFEIRKPFTTACYSFQILIPSYASIQAVHFLKQLYTSIHVHEKRQLVTQYIFQEIAKRKDRQEVFGRIKAFIPIEFQLLYPQVVEILEMLQVYYS